MRCGHRRVQPAQIVGVEAGGIAQQEILVGGDPHGVGVPCGNGVEVRLREVAVPEGVYFEARAGHPMDIVNVPIRVQDVIPGDGEILRLRARRGGQDHDRKNPEREECVPGCAGETNKKLAVANHKVTPFPKHQ